MYKALFCFKKCAKSLTLESFLCYEVRLYSTSIHCLPLLQFRLVEQLEPIPSGLEQSLAAKFSM